MTYLIKINAPTVIQTAAIKSPTQTYCRHCCFRRQKKFVMFCKRHRRITGHPR